MGSELVLKRYLEFILPRSEEFGHPSRSQSHVRESYVLERYLHYSEREGLVASAIYSLHIFIMKKTKGVAFILSAYDVGDTSRATYFEYFSAYSTQWRGSFVLETYGLGEVSHEPSLGYRREYTCIYQDRREDGENVENHELDYGKKKKSKNDHKYTE